jgi:hypothetical protein
LIFQYFSIPSHFETLASWRIAGEIISRTERHRPQAAIFPKATGFGGVGTD